MVRVCTPCKPNDRMLIGSTFEEIGFTLENCISECWSRKKCKALVYWPSLVYQGNKTLPKCNLHAEAKTYTTNLDTPVPYTPSVYKKGFHRNNILSILDNKY